MSALTTQERNSKTLISSVIHSVSMNPKVYAIAVAKRKVECDLVKLRRELDIYTSTRQAEIEVACSENLRRIYISIRTNEQSFSGVVIDNIRHVLHGWELVSIGNSVVNNKMQMLFGIDVEPIKGEN